MGDAQQIPLTGCGSGQFSGRLRQSSRAHLQWHQAHMDRAAGSHHFQGPRKTLVCTTGCAKSGASGTSQHTVVQLVCSGQIQWFPSTACAGSDLESRAFPNSRVKKSTSNRPSPPAARAPCEPSSLTTNRVPKRRARIMGACNTNLGLCPALATQLTKQRQSTKHVINGGCSSASAIALSPRPPRSQSLYLTLYYCSKSATSLLTIV